MLKTSREPMNIRALNTSREATYKKILRGKVLKYTQENI